MEGVKAERIMIKIGQSWESPRLHVLLTQEDDVVVARCLIQQSIPEISYA